MTLNELSVAVNMVKKESPATFTLSSLRLQLREIGVPMYNAFARALVSRGFIEKVGLTLAEGYQWAKPEPIHKDIVESLIKKARKRSSDQAKARRNKLQVAPQVEEVQEVKLTPKEELINRAIKILLDNGYKISKPITTYEEVTSYDL